MDTLDSAGRGSWALVTIAGDTPAWVRRLLDVIRSVADDQCELLGIDTAQPPKSLCRGAWLYDAFRGRKATSLEPIGSVEVGDIASADRAAFVSLTGTKLPPDAFRMSLFVDDQPCAYLQRAVERALLSGCGEVAIRAEWQCGELQQGSLAWNCALVEWSISVSVDRVADKLIGLVEHCVSNRFGHLHGSGVATYSRPIPAKVPVNALWEAVRRVTHRDQWAISVYQNVDETSVWPQEVGVNLIPPADRFWADPFLARDGSSLWVFFEELVLARSKGTIRCVCIDSDRRVSEPLDVMMQACHLSYPNVFMHDGEWYMLPETSERSDLVLYRATRFPQDWEPVACLLSGVKVVDATLFKEGEHWWLFAGVGGHSGAHFDDTMNLYRASTPFGPWVPSPHNPVRHDPSSARPAGPPFRLNGRWVRPVQDCRGRYGRALHLVAVDEVEDRGPREQWLASIEGVGAVRCVHTYSRSGRDLAVDWQRSRLRWSPVHQGEPEFAVVTGESR